MFNKIKSYVVKESDRLIDGLIVWGGYMIKSAVVLAIAKKGLGVLKKRFPSIEMFEGQGLKILEHIFSMELQKDLMSVL